MQQWPPLQRTVVPDDEDDDTAGINVEAAKERLRREDQEFDKKEYSRKIKEKHRVSPNTFPLSILAITYTITISSLIAWLVLSNLRARFIDHIYKRFSLGLDLQHTLKVYRLLRVSALH